MVFAPARYYDCHFHADERPRRLVAKLNEHHTRRTHHENMCTLEGKFTSQCGREGWWVRARVGCVVAAEDAESDAGCQVRERGMVRLEELGLEIEGWTSRLPAIEAH